MRIKARMAPDNPELPELPAEAPTHLRPQVTQHQPPDQHTTQAEPQGTTTQATQVLHRLRIHRAGTRSLNTTSHASKTLSHILELSD